jgi:hypothetical protein
MDIVLKAIRDLVSQIKLTVAESTNLSLAELERRLDDNEERLVIAPTARKYADQLRVLWAWLTEDDQEHPEYWMANTWIRRFALTPVYADDPITDEDIADDEEYRLHPGEVIGFLLAHDCEFVEGPYPTDEENEIFFEAQRGGWSRDDFGGDSDTYDDYDLRDPNEEGAWAEYLEPQGMAWVKSMIAWLEKQSEPAKSVEWVFDLGVENYLGGDLNVVALAMLVRELSVFVESKAELAKKARNVPWYSHVDRSLIGNLYQFMADFEGELDEIETDMVSEGRDVIWPWEEQRVADEWAAHFEQELEEHWTAQAKQRKPVLVEPAPPAPGAQAQVDGRPGNGQKIWASQFTGMGDVAYNLAYFKAVADGFTREEVQAAAIAARKQAKRPTRQWVPNSTMDHTYRVVGANERGLIFADKTMMPWTEAGKVAGRLSVEGGRKDKLLARMRQLWVSANGNRPHIERVGKVLAGGAA